MNRTLHDFVQYLTIKKSLKPNSIRLVLSRYSLFSRWLNGDAPTKERVENYLYHLKSKGLKNNSINAHLFMLFTLQSYLLDRNLISITFMDGIKMLPKTRPLINILTPEEIEAILTTDLTYGKFQGKDTSCLNDVYLAFTWFLATTGCRFQEAATLKPKDINLYSGKVNFLDTKNNENRTVWTTEPLITKLKRLTHGKKENDLVFVSFLGSPIIPQNYNGDLKRRAKKAGITKRVHPHLFRHSFATQLLISGVEITRVASLLGHKDIQTTYQNYVHLADETLRKAMFHHPLIRKNIDPKELLKMIHDAISSLGLENDPRFNYRIEENDHSVRFEAYLK